MTQNTSFQGVVNKNGPGVAMFDSYSKTESPLSFLVDQFNVTLNPTQQLNDTLFTASDRALAVLLPSNRHLSRS